MLRVAVGFMCLAAVVCAANIARAENGGRFHQVLELDGGRRLVVEESSLEPRSLGSYSLRLYSGRNPDFPYDDFITGLLLSRDGVLESVSPAEAEADGQRVHILIRSVGSGSYLSRHSIQVSGAALALVDSHSGLPPDTVFD